MGNKPGTIDPGGEQPGYATASGRIVSARKKPIRKKMKKKTIAAKDTRPTFKREKTGKSGAVLASLGQDYQEKDKTVFEGRNLDTIRNDYKTNRGGGSGDGELRFEDEGRKHAGGRLGEEAGWAGWVGR